MVRKLLKDAADRLKNSDTPMLDARVLLAFAMGKSDAALIFNMPDENELSLFNSYVEKRESGMPVAYILGEKEFMGLKFRLNPDTLIPRPDTECLVERIAELVGDKKVRILDLCTGSGCIGISLAKLLPDATCDLTDISSGALSAAEENSILNGTENRTRVFKLDVLGEEFPKGYDIIVSNPPYIESGLIKDLEVSEFEPTRALDGGEDGLSFYRAIVQKAYGALDNNGILALEIGYDQGESVTELLSNFSQVKLFKDYGGNDRVIMAIK